MCVCVCVCVFNMIKFIVVFTNSILDLILRQLTDVYKFRSLFFWSFINTLRTEPLAC